MQPCRDDGLEVIAQGLFSGSTQVQKIAFDILKKLGKSKLGRLARNKMNLFHELKYQELKLQYLHQGSA